MNSPVYLDYAATSAIRPPEVIAAITSYLTDVGATPGRSAHRLALEAGRIALRCRRQLAMLLDIPGDPGRIVFTSGATHATNMAMHGVLSPGQRMVVTQLDHNAVLRPAAVLQARGVDVRMVAADRHGALDETALEQELEGARLLCINGASNVLGTVLDVQRLAEQARSAGVLTMLDAAQWAGHRPLSVSAAGVDMVALTGHKGLLGPQGIGALWVREGVTVEPLLTGGAGGDSLDRHMPDAYPDHLEAGTSNAPGIAGMLAGLEWLTRTGVAALHARLMKLARRLEGALLALPNVVLLSPPGGTGVPIVTIAADPIDPATLALRLDREHAVLVRPGLHCAPEVHRLLGTTERGAVRFSLGWATDDEDVDRAVRAVAAVTSCAGEQG